MNGDAPTGDELQMRAHSWRNFEPEEFIHAVQAAERVDDRDELDRIHDAFLLVEDKRLNDMLVETHQFFRALDRDEAREWIDRNPDMFEWVVAYGYVTPAMNRFRSFHDYDGPPYDD